MTVSRTISLVLRIYPADWRARYGDELEALVVDMTGGGRVPWRVRGDLIGGGVRERWRAAGLSGEGPAEMRARDGALVVMWAWALLILGGSIVAKTTERWQTAMAPGGARITAGVAFDALMVSATATGGVVLAGVGLALPSVLGPVREGGWPRIRGRLKTAALLSAAALAATGGLVAWAHGAASPARNGRDTAYSIAFVAWGSVCATALLAWTSAAAGIARHLRLGLRILRAEVRLACMAAVGMITAALAMVVWWVAVGGTAPGALTGGPDSDRASPIVARLVIAAVIMLSAATLGSAGARRAGGAINALS